MDKLNNAYGLNFVAIQDEKLEKECRRLPTLYLSMPFTRRKMFHYVLDENNNVIWKGQVASDAIDAIVDMGHLSFVLDQGSRRFMVDMTQLKIERV